MNILITPSKTSGTITAPPSKSYTHRAIILASLAKGVSHITNWLDSDDTRATIEACRVLGAKINAEPNQLTIEGIDGKPNLTGDTIDCNASGTTMRLITAVAALSRTPLLITGSKRLCERPIQDLTNALISIGAKVEYLQSEGFPPFKISGGTLEGGIVSISGETSSQYISALHLISPFCNKPLIIEVQGNGRSKSYIDMTLNSMHSFGYAKDKNYYEGQEYEVEGDFSQASYFFAAAAITDGTITVKGLNKDSKQGDKYLLDLLKYGGCSVSWDGTSCTVSGKCKELPDSIDMGNYPDIVQTAAALAAHIPQKTTITNIAHLAHKETDRIANTVKALNSLGVEAKYDNDSITIEGGSVKGGTIDTYGDHRMAMSMAVAALAGIDKSTIKNSEVVKKSYPNFWGDLKLLNKDTL